MSKDVEWISAGEKEDIFADNLPREVKDSFGQKLDLGHAGIWLSDTVLLEGTPRELRAYARELMDAVEQIDRDPATFVRTRALKDYADRIEELARRYEPQALSILNRIRDLLVQAGTGCVEPYQMFDDNYRWAFATKNAEGHVGEGSVDYTIEIAERRDYDGADADPGINFGLNVVEWGGLIRGEFNPFNFTPDVWVDAYDDDAVESRWRAFAEVNVDVVARLAIPTPG